MKINLEVVHSCTIKSKKPWPKIHWIGKDKQQLYLADGQRVNQIDPRNGKTKRKVGRLSQFVKSIVAFNLTKDGVHFCGILTSGDLIIWNKDTDQLRSINGRNEFALKLGFNCPSIFVSNDTRKIILITSRNKVYVWETDQLTGLTTDKSSHLFNSCKNIVTTEGNWSAIVASKDIKTVEDSKELVLDVKFKINLIDGASAVCCFVFNYENQMVVNVLKIKWISQSEITSQSQCRFETLWISYEPTESQFNNSFNLSCTSDTLNRKTCLNTRGAYVVRLSNSADLIALASNQKHVERNSLVFMSPANGAICPVSLRNFGLGSDARGRNYWIQELNWMYNDLYVAGITKHGAIFLVSRLGNPLLIHAIGKETMGPALYLTLHPLIIFRGKSYSNTPDVSNGSISSTQENEDAQRQRYCIKSHPSLPIFACSDGFLMCVFKLDTAYSTQSRLMREIMHETIGLLNAVSKQTQHEDNYYHLESPFEQKSGTKSKKKSRRSQHKLDSSLALNEHVPDWGLSTSIHLNNTADNNNNSGSDSGVDSNDTKERTQMPKYSASGVNDIKIAEGKIIFSYLPQVLPISQETLKTDSVVDKMENAFEYLQSSWTLLTSMSTDSALRNTHESDQTAKAIQQAFTHFSYLFLTLDSSTLRQFQIYKHEYTARNSNNQRLEEEFRVKVLVDLFIRMLKFLHFDPASKSNPNSHMLIYIPRFVEKFCQSLLKFETVFSSESIYNSNRTKLFGLVYSLLNLCETLMKSVYSLKLNDRFFLNVDSILSQKVPISSIISPAIKALSESNLEEGEVAKENTTQEMDGHSTEGTNANNNAEQQQQLDKSWQDGNAQQQSQILMQANQHEPMEFVDFLFEKCWTNLMHYACKYRGKLAMLGTIRARQLKDLDCFVIILERRMQKFPTSFNKNAMFHKSSTRQLMYKPIHRRGQIFKVNKADLIYLDLGNLDTAIDQWIIQLNELVETIASLSSQKRVARSKKQAQTSMLAYAVYKSVRTAHKIFYACLANYRLRKLIQFINMFFQLDVNNSTYSPFNLLDCTFKYIRAGKPLQKAPIAILSVIKSLARLMALYFTNKDTLFIYSVNNPVAMPGLLEKSAKTTDMDVRIELSKSKLTSCINNQAEEFHESEGFSLADFKAIDLGSFWSTDKALELFIVTGLYREATYFAQLVNDWKSSFLISSILKEAEGYDAGELDSRFSVDDMNAEKLLSTKLCAILGIDKDNQNKNGVFTNKESTYTKLMEKGELNSTSSLIKELLLCSVMTRSNTLEPLLKHMLESLVSCTNQLTSNSALVPAEFYLPAPPVFCLQMNMDQETMGTQPSRCVQVETELRSRLYILCKCIIILLTSANLHAPLIKWYLEQLINSAQEMKQTYGLANQFKVNHSLKTLLISIRYQKLGYIPDELLLMFRDFCAVIFYLDLRDKFSLSLRQYTRYFIQNQAIKQHDPTSTSSTSKNVVQMCLKIIDLGNTLISFSSFLKAHYMEVKDIVLSMIARLTKLSQDTQISGLNLEQKLATLVGKKSYFESYPDLDTTLQQQSEEFVFSSESFNGKLSKLLESWKEILSTQGFNSDGVEMSMAEIYEHICLVNEQGSARKLEQHFGHGEAVLNRIYELNEARDSCTVTGGYDFERSQTCGEFLELFFKLGFEQSEEWEPMVQAVNETPLLPEFYDVIRDRELPQDFVDKQYLMEPLFSRADEQKGENQGKGQNGRSNRRRSIISNLSVAGPNKVGAAALVSQDSVVAETTNEGQANRQIGLFRSYSIRSDSKLKIYEEKLEILSKKSVSFTVSNNEQPQQDNCSMISYDNEPHIYNCNNDPLKQVLDQQQAATEPYSIEQPFKVINLGYQYIEPSNLAIWLIKWATKFQKTLMAHKTAASFWYSGNNNKADSENINSTLTTLKLSSVNANFLVSCVYLANNNNLEYTALHFIPSKQQQQEEVESSVVATVHSAKQRADTFEDDFTQISNSFSVTAKTKDLTKITEMSSHRTLNSPDPSSMSTTLDISSLTQDIKNNQNSTLQLANRSIASYRTHRRQNSGSSFKELTARSADRQPAVANNSELTNQTLEFEASSTRADLMVASTSDAYDFYNLKKLGHHKWPSQSLERSRSIHNESSFGGGSRLEVEQKHIFQGANKDAIVREKRKSSGSLEFLANIFNRGNSKSPSLSKSPVKQTSNNTQSTSPSKNPILKLFRSKSQDNTDIQNPMPQRQEPAGNNNTDNNNNNVQDMIRTELKRIVQMQHDTVMTFLNGAAPPAHQYQQQPSFQTQNRINQQLSGLLKQQHVSRDQNGEPVEFIIETKVKTIDANGQIAYTDLTLPQQQQQNHFMREFNYNQATTTTTPRPVQSRQSNLIKIPLLSSQFDDSQSNRLPLIQNNERQPKTGRQFSLLDFNNQSKYSDYIKPEKKKSAKQQTYGLASQKLRNFPLLKLNYQASGQQPTVTPRVSVRTPEPPVVPTIQIANLSPSDEEQQQPSIKGTQSIRAPSVKSTQSSEAQSHRVNQTVEADKETQCQKPMYDGYILAPDAFEEMKLEDNRDPYSEMQYKATEHLRENQSKTEQQRRANKRETFTTTDSLSGADPLAPAILFRMRFDADRKGRNEMEDVDDDDGIKDFVNVVDLDNRAVDDILTLIEMEQNKRQGKFVELKPKRKLETVNEPTDSVLVGDSSVAPLSMDIPSRKASTGTVVSNLLNDSLTNKLLNPSREEREDEWKEYDELVNRQMEEASKKAGLSVSKQRILNEFKFIDDKIRAMNEMADHMNADYAKYSQVLGTVDEMRKQREAIERYQSRQWAEEKRQQQQTQEVELDKPEDVTFYETADAAKQVTDLKRSLNHQRKTQTVKKSVEMNNLSDLRESEEQKIAQLLEDGESKDPVNETGTRDSYQNLLQDVFEDLSVGSGGDLDSTKIDEIIERSSRKSSVPSSGKEMIPTRDLTPTSSMDRQVKGGAITKPKKSKPVVKPKTGNAAKEDKTPQVARTKPIAVRKTSPHVNHKASPSVERDRQMSARREHLKEEFMVQREQDAQDLLADIMLDNSLLHEQQRQLEQIEIKSSNKALDSFRHKSKSPKRNSVVSAQSVCGKEKIIAVPNLSLEFLENEVKCSEMAVKNKKPSLMAQTIMELERKEAMKQKDTDRLLKDLEKRAMDVNKPEATRTMGKQVVPFTSLVRMQKPSRLRNKTEHKPLTYGQILSQHQERVVKNSVKPEATAEEICKIYGTHRVPGMYQGYVKSTARTVKTYQEICRDTKPAQSQAKTNLMPKVQNTRMVQAKLSNQRQRRYKPYDPNVTGDNLDVKVEDMSDWSLDENMKDILYGAHKPIQAAVAAATAAGKKSKKPPKVKYQKDYDEDTLADIDGDNLLQDLLEDEKQNEKMYQSALRDLSNLEDSTDLGGCENDYLSQVNVDDLKNISLSSESAISSFIDWDQIDQMIGVTN